MMIFLIALMSIMVDSACATKNGADDYRNNNSNITRTTYDGRGVSANFNQAVAWYKKLAKQGNDTAQLVLGNMYFYGVGGTDINYCKAKKWYERAARRGNAVAQGQLDYMRYYQDNEHAQYLLDL